MRTRILLICGVLSPCCYAVAEALAGTQWESYSFRDQTISELGAIGAPSRALFSMLLVPVYLLLVAFGFGVWQAAGDRRRMRLAGALVVALGVLALGVGMFVPMRPRGVEQGLTGALHVIEGMLAMLIVVTAMGFAAADLGRRFRLSAGAGGGAMRKTALVGVLLVAAACATPENPLDEYEEVDATTLFVAPPPTGITPANEAAVARGKYLVELLGCGACHTEGALVGRANMHRWLAGSSVGIAYTNPLAYDRPGVVFPPNITPDPETGIGRWSREQIAAAIRAGAGRHGRGRILVMPWPGYAKLTDEDVYAIVDYLRAIEPINSRVPENVPPGQFTSQEYVHFGVYRKR